MSRGPRATSTSPRRLAPRARRTLVVVVLTLAVLMLSGASGAVGAVGAADPGHGQWSAPVAPVHVVHGFEPPAQRWLAGHRGIDLRAAAGGEVRAVDAGVVVWAGDVAGMPVVSVVHVSGVRSTYQPVEAIVAVGETVERGQPLGTLVDAGSHCAPSSCLHLGARRAQTYLDPSLLLGLRGPRLLPYLSAGRLGPVPVSPGTRAADDASERQPVLLDPVDQPSPVEQVVALLASALAAIEQMVLA